MARYLSKPVHESVVVDDMETGRNWAATGAATRDSRRVTPAS
jgi:hypothetical protein